MSQDGDSVRLGVSANETDAAGRSSVSLSKRYIPSSGYLRFLRFSLARVALWAFGVSLKGGVEQVANLWKLPATRRKDWIDKSLAVRPIYVNGLTINSIEALEHAPSLSKSTLRALTADAVAEQRAGAIKRQTAGTTGKATTVYLSKNELSRMLRVRDYCLSKCGVRLGDREGRLWGRPQNGFEDRLKNWLMNRKVFCPSGPAAVEVVRQLTSYKPDYLYGYASLIFEAAKIIDKYDIPVPKVKCVICTAESILPAQKEYISRQFNAPVREEYGSTEFDIIAFECDQGHMHLVNPWLVVTAREDKTLVSDISRTSVDLVQYDLGDSLKLVKSPCKIIGSSEVIATIGGRSMDRYAWVSQNERFHAVEFAHALNSYSVQYADVLGFTVVQTDFGHFNLSVDQKPKLALDQLSLWITNFIKREVGYLIKVQVQVKDTDTEQHNGKRSYFIPMDFRDDGLAG